MITRPLVIVLLTQSFTSELNTLRLIVTIKIDRHFVQEKIQSGLITSGYIKTKE